MADKSKTKSNGGSKSDAKRALRSRQWFDNPDNPGMTALYLERYLNFGLTPRRTALRQADHRHRADRLRSFALQPPSSRTRQARARRHPRGRRHRVRISRSPDPGDRQAPDGGARPQSRLSRPRRDPATATPLDGVVLTTGCDKTTPACIMAAATVNIPAIVLSGGPMLNGWHHGRAQRLGHRRLAGARRTLPRARSTMKNSWRSSTSSAPSVGHCNTMGTASTMNALAEALGMSLPGCAAIPAPYRERGQIAYETGQRIVEMVWEDLKPSDILTREAFENAIVVNSRHRRLDQRADPHQRHRPPHRRAALDRGLGDDRPQGAAARQHAARRQISGRRISPRRRRCRRSINELMKRKLIHENALTVNGKTHGRKLRQDPFGRSRRHHADRQAVERGRRLRRAAAAICSTTRS